MTSRFHAIIVAGLAATACGGGSRPVPPLPSAGLSPQQTDSLFRLGEAAFNRGDWAEAQGHFERAGAGLVVADPRFTRLRFYQAEILFAQGSHLQAVREFRRIADERPDDPLAPDALLRAGETYADLWRRPELDPTYGETALAVYQELQTRYQGTPAARRAGQRLLELQERFARKEYRNALFYFRYKAYDSAILLLRSLLAEYPRSAVAPEALERLVRAYQLLGYVEDERETCAYIAQYHPDPAGPRRLCRAVEAAPRDTVPPGGRGGR